MKKISLILILFASLALSQNIDKLEIDSKLENHENYIISNNNTYQTASSKVFIAKNTEEKEFEEIAIGTDNNLTVTKIIEFFAT